MSFQPLWEISALQAPPPPAGEVLSFPENMEDPETAPLGLVPELVPDTVREGAPENEANVSSDREPEVLTGCSTMPPHKGWLLALGLSLAAVLGRRKR